MAIIEIKNFSFAYPVQKAEPGTELRYRNVLNDINLQIEDGEFVLLCGQSGCGKTTLLRQLKPEIAPHGKKQGDILYNIEGNAPSYHHISTQIGFVMQNPDNQIVTDKVWHELAFGLENQGLPSNVIRRRVAEISSFFGISEWFRKDTSQLSGGQKQMLNLAGIMAMQPKILILDEPTSQLDPIAAVDFLETVAKLNRDLGITIILTEHRLEEVFPISDRVIIMENGTIISDESPQNTALSLSQLNNRHAMFAALPTPVRVYAESIKTDTCPLTIKEGRTWISKHKTKTHLSDSDSITTDDTVVLSMKNCWFRYDRNLPDIMRGVNLELQRGEIYCLMGGNGTGKSTTLNVAASLYPTYRGKIEIMGKSISKYRSQELFDGILAAVPQNPQMLFTQNTLRKELAEMTSKNKNDIIDEIAGLLGILHLLDNHPYDLSGGEQQKAAFAKIMMLNPRIILLDEPTKGLDAHFKEDFAKILKTFTNQGISILMATHDIEFAAQYANRCALFFDGIIISEDTPKNFFKGNNYYTTAANRMARHICADAVTCGDVVALCREN